MFRQLWKNSYKSVCSIQFYTTSHNEVLGVTGFKVGNKILTDDVVYSVRDASEVAIRFYMEDGITIHVSKSLPYKDFLSLLAPRDDYGNLGFTLIPDDFQEFREINGLSICHSCSNQIGRSLGVIGYQSEHKNLSLKTGFISASYTSDKGLGYIQYDGTIKLGNSGAPLLDAEHGNVLGVVMNKELPITKSYHELQRIIESNIQVLKEVEGRFQLYEIDPVQVLIANQNQIRHIAKEFFLNATVKLGFALEIEHVAEFLDGSSALDLESDQASGD